MKIHEISDLLLYCAAVNYAILFVWFAAFAFAHDGLHRLHKRWFRLPIESFDTLHYAGMSVYKIGILLLNLVPGIVLHFSS